MTPDIVDRLRGNWWLNVSGDEAADEIERLREIVRQRTKVLDDQLGTPCEQIRHEQEIEQLQGELQTVHAHLRAAAASGVAILLISEDLDELMTLSDRIAVMYEGRIMGEVDAATAAVDEIGLMMAGAQHE